jgi:hypothetical protein
LTIFTIAEMEREEMNKDKAIQLLERLQDPEPYEPMLTKDAYDAIQMAIDALSADGDTISRKSAIGVLHEALDRVDQIADVPFGVYQNYRDKMNELPPTQPEIVRCKDCKYWNSGSCEYREHAVNCDGYSVGDIETEAEHFCGYAEKREVTEWTM